MLAKNYELNSMFSSKEGIPAIVTAIVLRETPRAVYLYGHGSIEAQTKFGACAKCGKVLSHPGSMVLGIGPECLKNWGLREETLLAMGPEMARETMGKMILGQRVDKWVPKGCIKSTIESEEDISAPSTHPMLKTDTVSAVSRTAEVGPHGLIEIKFSYNAELVDAVKSIEGRRWAAETKTWTAPVTETAVEILKYYSFVFGPKLEEMCSKIGKVEEVALQEIPGLKVVPRPFQYEGIAKVDSFRGRILIADEPGLGKTVQAIGWMQLHPEARPAIVVCPASLKEMWAGKIKLWMGKEKVEVLNGRPSTKQKGLPKASIYVINYDIIGNKIDTIPPKTEGGRKKRIEKEYTGWVDYLCDKKPKAVILDECHYCRDPKNVRTTGCIKLVKKTDNAICLSGTPIKNRPIEFWPVLNSLAPAHFSNYWKFVKRYCGAKHNGFGWTYNGSSNVEELHEILNKIVMIRRLKSEVLTELPPKQRAAIPLPVDPKHMREYKAIEAELKQAAKEKKDKITVLTIITALKQAATRCKMEAALEWIEDFLESGEKLVVFAHHHFAVDILRERFSKITKIAEITGRTVGSKAEQERMFQEDPECRLFIGSKSAMEGLTLTAASNMAFLEFYDTPGDHAQAEDRIHRIGQEAESITAWYLVAAGTMDEKIADMIDKKLAVLKQILDGEEIQEEEMITALLRWAMETK